MGFVHTSRSGSALTYRPGPAPNRRRSLSRERARWQGSRRLGGHTIAPTETTQEEILAHHYRLSEQVVVDRLGDSLVAVQLGTDKIFELNETATRLVELLGEGSTAEAAAQAIAGEYDAELDAVRQDVVDTIKTLVAESMLEVATADA